MLSDIYKYINIYMIYRDSYGRKRESVVYIMMVWGRNRRAKFQPIALQIMDKSEEGSVGEKKNTGSKVGRSVGEKGRGCVTGSGERN